ncbi:unnamed protein product [Cyberlindnera jadinii]|uniref:Uncharacterized protein n=1 Tax=Cyberlindnera jadinii (strain ATCC 18201 / CBS 1600 / BCRC 20928 / JCM 3617 / NBRC 0987 / NRRL Y-1542) TaxID=983966 RepID=A0A0H5C0J3_CYBJN|nr:hypothetical protein CYBJADRAFT_160301 [Cyberlindnera jadinii NRRL Y-1542]ODV76330.1 hypothetical protein CYBJADRAFT_160301 [Cyberlindnera jadinii NRRL Y-1542]CEP20982.1 unnamed protein product [Cyberlindnera jadinii]
MSDSSFNYTHMRRSHHVLHMEQWYRDELEDEDIDTLPVNQDFSSFLQSISSLSFGSTKNKKPKDPKWKDTHADMFLSDDKQWWDGMKDDTLLKSLEMNRDLSASTSTAFTIPHTMEKVGEHDFGVGSSHMKSPIPELTTPILMRKRESKKANSQNYKTPVGRIVR